MSSRQSTSRNKEQTFEASQHVSTSASNIQELLMDPLRLVLRTFSKVRGNDYVTHTIVDILEIFKGGSNGSSGDVSKSREQSKFVIQTIANHIENANSL
jgi:hypothetical protein